MTSPIKRADLDAQMRKKYMRMKTANNHEDVKLEKTKLDLNKVAVTSLEHHLQTTKEMSDLWTRCSTTTGWFDDAVKPKKRDLRSSMMTDFKVMTKPWAYCTRNTIEMWEKHPGTSRKNNYRPKTALGTYTDPAAAQSDQQTSPSSALQQPHKRPHTAGQLHAQPNAAYGEAGSFPSGAMLQQRAKSARIHFTPISFQSPRLQDGHVKANTRPQRPITAGATLQYGPRKNSAVVESTRKLASAVHRHRYDLASMDDEVFESMMTSMNHEQDTVGPLPVKATPKADLPPPPPGRNLHSQTSINESEADKENNPTSPSPIRRASVSFKRRDSVILQTMLQRHKSNASAKSDTKSEQSAEKVDSSSVVKEKSEDDAKDDDQNSDEKLTGKKKKKKTTLPKWNMPKFYVKPQERYKTEDMFLMRRYLMLQRQLASEMPPEMLESPKLSINIAFSQQERRKRLGELMQENSHKERSSQRSVKETGLRCKIDKFLTEIDHFIEKQKDEE